MKHACTCSTFHFISLNPFAYEVIVLSSADIFFQNHFVSCFLKRSLGNISRVLNSLDPDHALRFVEPDLDPNCLQR